MAQPTLRTNASRSRLVRSGLPSSRSNDRIQPNAADGGVENSASGQALRNKASRTAMSSAAPTAASLGKVVGGVEQRRRAALSDKTNGQNASHGADTKDHTLKHKPVSTTTHTVRREASTTAKQRPLSAVADSAPSKEAAAKEQPALAASNSYAGHRHLRGVSSSSGTGVGRPSSTDVSMAEAASSSSQRSSLPSSTGSALTIAPNRETHSSSSRRAVALSLAGPFAVVDEMGGGSTTVIQQQGEQLHLVRPNELLHPRAPSPAGVQTDEDMSEAESEWRSSSIEGGLSSSKTDAEDGKDVALAYKASTAVASSDEELIDVDDDDDEIEYEDEGDEDEDDASVTDSVLLDSLDPDCLVSLPHGLEELARQRVEQISQRYAVTVLQPSLERQFAKVNESLMRGEITAKAAARDAELISMGFDPDEARDTSMVTEYSKEIFEYMAKCEARTMANPDYMEFQGEIRWHMRATLVDWLMQVHLRYRLMPETLWIAINVIDRFLSARVVSLAKLQLVGVTAMFIAAKYEEILAPSVDEFVFMTENGYTKEEILKGERIILSTLDFNISSYCSPYSWIRRISKADDYELQTRTLAKFLMELSLFDHRFLRAKPSLIAAVAMYLARKMLGGTWNEAFVYYSQMVEEQLIPGANLLLEKLSEDAFLDNFICKKYGNRKFLRASIFAREWALRHQETMLVPSESVSSSICVSMGAMQGSDGQVPEQQHLHQPASSSGTAVPFAPGPSAAVY